MSVRIIIDSTVDLTPEIKNQLLIVPLTVHFGETEYVDGVTITHKEFYEKLIESDVLPTTSQATPFDFGNVFEEVVEAGDTAVVITVSSKLSGTYQSACIAASDYPNKIFVVDSLSVAIGAGILAELALKMAKEGLDAPTIAQKLNQEKENICLIAMVDTLEYLCRGGRLSKTAALVGGMLSIKPVIALNQGEIVVLGKARGSKQSNNLLIKEIQKAGGIDFDKPIMLGYTGLSDHILLKYIDDSAFLWEDRTSALRYAPMGSVIGTHAGPGAIGAAFFKK